jgi:DNA-binding transcriptional MerR regulator
MKMQKIKFRIGELAQQLNVECFVIRFWEKEFSFKSNRSHGGQRFYGEKDLARFALIKDLLYNQGFTIAGAKKKLFQSSTQKNPIIGCTKTSMEIKTLPADKKIDSLALNNSTQEELTAEIIRLKTQLRKLRELL